MTINTDNCNRGDPLPMNPWILHISLGRSTLMAQMALLGSVSCPTIQEHEDLVWLAGNLKLEVTNYSRELYGPEGAAHPSIGDDDDGGKKEDSKATLSYQPRKRRHR